MAAEAYVDGDFIRLVGSMPPADIDALEVLYPGVVEGVSKAVSRLFDSKLIKRYAAPFEDPIPEALRWNVAHVVVSVLWQKRGYNPGSAQDQIIEKNKAEAFAWLTEAADSEKGLVELPLRQGDPEAVTKGGPLGYSEASPFVWTDIQAEAARFEDGR